MLWLTIYLSISNILQEFVILHMLFNSMHINQLIQFYSILKVTFEIYISIKVVGIY